MKRRDRNRRTAALNYSHLTLKAICNHKIDKLPPQTTIFNKVIPIIMHFFKFSPFKVNYFGLLCTSRKCLQQCKTRRQPIGNNISSDVEFTTAYHRIHDILLQIFDVIRSDNFWHHPIRCHVIYVSAFKHAFTVKHLKLAQKYFNYLCTSTGKKLSFIYTFSSAPPNWLRISKPGL